MMKEQTRVKRMVEPEYLVYNAGNNSNPEYRKIKFKDLIDGDSVIHVKDRHGTNTFGILRKANVVDHGDCYFFDGLLLEGENGALREFKGTVAGLEAKMNPKYVKKELLELGRKTSSLAISAGYNLYFDGLVDIAAVGRVSFALKKKEMERIVEGAYTVSKLSMK